MLFYGVLYYKSMYICRPATRVEYSLGAVLHQGLTTSNIKLRYPRNYRYEQEWKLLQRNRVSKVIAETKVEAREQ